MRSTIGMCFFLLAALFSSVAANAQFTKIKSITHTGAILAGVDRPGELYLIAPDSTITRFDIDGKVQQTGSLPFLPEVFDPRDGSRLFAFDANTKQYIHFTPFFSFQNSPSRPDSAFALEPAFICSSGDHDMVILDAADRSLKKINLRSERLMFESIIPDSALDFNAIQTVREYQNFIFVLDREKGIRIFNMMGRPLRTIVGHDIAYFSFLGEELYYAQGASLKFFNLFTAETRTLELPHSARFALLTDERLFLVDEKSVDIFSLNP